MHISLQGQTVVVTGGAVRLGRAIALACAQAGASVAITYRTSRAEAMAAVEALRAASPDAEQQFAAFSLDATRAAEVANLVGQVRQRFGRVTALVNNAAIFRRTPFEAMSEADFDDHIGANLKGPYLLCKAFGDVFLEENGGSIVNIADIHGLRPLKNYVPYCVSKAGLVMLSQALARALAPKVRVNCLCPGTILTPSQTQGEDDDEAALTAKIPLGRLGEAEEVAAAAVFLIGGPAFITGAVLPIDGAQRLR